MPTVPKMGYRGYSDEELQRVLDRFRWMQLEPGSVGDRAHQDALAEWERRQRAPEDN